MEDDKALKLEINLQRMAYVKIATVLWANDDIETKITDYFADLKSWNMKLNDETWAEIALIVVHKSTELCLPKKLLTELRNVLIRIGERLRSWKMHMKRPQSDFSSLKVHWTCQGLIDEKTVFSNWQYDSQQLSHLNKNNNFKDRLPRLPRFSVLNMVCAYARQDFVMNRRDRIIKELAQLYEHGEDVGPKLLSMWFENLNQVQNIIGSDSVDESQLRLRTNINVILLEYIIPLGFVHLFKQLWNRMKYMERQNLMEKLITGGYLQRYRYFDGRVPYKEEKMMEIIIFVINNMTDEQRIEFFKRNDAWMLLRILSFWPYHDIFPQFFNEVKHYLNYEDDYSGLFDAFLHEVKCDILSKYFELYKNFPTNLEILLAVTPSTIKERFVSIESLKYEILEIAITIRLLINDHDLQNHRAKIFRFCKPTLEYCLWNGNFKSCEKFMEEVFSDSEKKKFQENFTSIANRLIIFEFDDVWYPRNQKKSLSFSEINNYLTWQFNTPEEIRNFKNVLVNSKEFLYEKIYGLFLTSWYVKHASSFDLKKSDKKAINRTKEMCNDLLKWLLGSAAKVEFQKNNLGRNQEFLEKYIYKVVKKNGAGNLLALINHFLNFFSAPSDTVFDLKYKICNEINNWIVHVCFYNQRYSERLFTNICMLISWVFPVHVNAKEIIVKFVNSPDGVRLYEKWYLRRFDCFSYGLENYLNHWIKPFGVFPEIIKHINNLIADEGDRFVLISILNMLENKEELTSYYEVIKICHRRALFFSPSPSPSFSSSL